MKKTIIALIIIVIIIVYFVFRSPTQPVPVDENTPTATDTTVSTTTSTQSIVLTNGAVSVIGKSVNGRDINVYHYGNSTSTTEILFVGGIHGGYEWNTALVAYQLMDYLKANPSIIPSNIKVTVIPILNPDGLNKAVGTTTGNFTQSNVTNSSSDSVSSRFNSNNVDLNRNFDCDWQTSGVWQSKTVSGGGSAFSEPESLAIKNYVEMNKPTAVVVWYSAAGGVYASNCHSGVLPETKTIAKAYADASGYPYFESFDFYATTGDMVNWLAKNNIPAISVLLTNHTNTELSKNQAGVRALFEYYSK
jgi:murein tripeptide amidase MpaA